MTCDSLLVKCTELAFWLKSTDAAYSGYIKEVLAKCSRAQASAFISSLVAFHAQQRDRLFRPACLSAVLLAVFSEPRRLLEDVDIRIQAYHLCSLHCLAKHDLELVISAMQGDLQSTDASLAATVMDTLPYFEPDQIIALLRTGRLEQLLLSGLSIIHNPARLSAIQSTFTVLRMEKVYAACCEGALHERIGCEKALVALWRAMANSSTDRVPELAGEAYSSILWLLQSGQGQSPLSQVHSPLLSSTPSNTASDTSPSRKVPAGLSKVHRDVLDLRSKLAAVVSEQVFLLWEVTFRRLAKLGIGRSLEGDGVVMVMALAQGIRNGYWLPTTTFLQPPQIVDLGEASGKGLNGEMLPENGNPGSKGDKSDSLSLAHGLVTLVPLAISHLLPLLKSESMALQEESAWALLTITDMVTSPDAQAAYKLACLVASKKREEQAWPAPPQAPYPPNFPAEVGPICESIRVLLTLEEKGVFKNPDLKDRMVELCAKGMGLVPPYAKAEIMSRLWPAIKRTRDKSSRLLQITAGVEAASGKTRS